MLESYAIGVGVVVGVCVAWVGVKIAWRRVFADVVADPDALAGRSSCHGCGCTSTCERRDPGGAGSIEEGIR
jgi:hypothetical protein